MVLRLLLRSGDVVGVLAFRNLGRSKSRRAIKGNRNVVTALMLHAR